VSQARTLKAPIRYLIGAFKVLAYNIKNSLYNLSTAATT